jgi:nitrite reductase/ring-hydroxylating ferredoxin subunit
MTDSSLNHADSTDFAPVPAAWYYIGSMRELARGPVKFELPGEQRLVSWLAEGGRPVVLAARCAHMGADLARGCVRTGRLACPLHGWEYGADGHCKRIPAIASDQIPDFARQASFPTEERGGQVFFFNRPEAHFPMPFFDGVKPAELLAAPVFEYTVDAPWWLVGANGFDAQHFRCAHDRTLCGEPVVDSPHALAWRVRAVFCVTGTSIFERLTRLISGRQVEMTVTNWGGNLILVTARFRRTTTHGLVSLVPLENNRTLLRDLVWVPRRRLIGPWDARIRRQMIREFVRADVEASHGIRYEEHRMIDADKVLVGYLDWLRRIHR